MAAGAAGLTAAASGLVRPQEADASFTWQGGALNTADHGTTVEAGASFPDGFLLNLDPSANGNTSDIIGLTVSGSGRFQGVFATAGPLGDAQRGGVQSYGGAGLANGVFAVGGGGGDTNGVVGNGHAAGVGVLGYGDANGGSGRGIGGYGGLPNGHGAVGIGSGSGTGVVGTGGGTSGFGVLGTGGAGGGTGVRAVGGTGGVGYGLWAAAGSPTSMAVVGDSGSIGVFGSGTQCGVLGSAVGNGVGLAGVGAGASGAPLLLQPSGSSGTPPGPNNRGDIWVDTSGVLYVCVVAGSPGTWVAIQTGGSTDPTRSNFFRSAVTTQPNLVSSNGATWTDMAGGPTLAITPRTNCTAVLSANADLFTDTAGYNQDLGIKVSGGVYPTAGGQPETWKESGGVAAALSPTAAFVQTAIPLLAGTSYAIKLQWKTNKNAPGATIWAGAGPIAGKGSPTSLSAHLIVTA